MRLNCPPGRRLRDALLSLAMFAGWATMAFAQSSIATGSITGVVTDPSGGAAGGVQVIVADRASRRAITFTTTPSGLYSSGPITAGTYTVRLDVKGFVSVEFQVVVHTGEISAGNIRLRPTSDKKNTPPVRMNTGTAGAEGIVRWRQLEDLPLNGRNPLDATQLEPGVQIKDAAELNSSQSGFFAVSIGGGPARTTRSLLDGIDLTDARLGGVTENLSLSSIHEFQVAQSPLDLSSPMTTSGTVSAISRSGSNDYHGGGFYGFRDKRIGSAAFPGGSDSNFQRNQFGGNVGGALIRNKLYFFLDGERTKQDWRNIPALSYPFNALGASYNAPFRDNTFLGRMDWVGENVRAFFRANYDEDSDVGRFNSYSPFQTHDVTPGVAGGVDFNRGSFAHSLRLGYSHYSNHLGSSSAGFLSISPSLSIENTGIDAGPSPFGPQSTVQSSMQVRYDGTRVWNNHVIRFGAAFNRIATGGSEALGSAAPIVAGSATFGNEQQILGNPNSFAPALVAGDAAGALDNPLNYPVAAITISNGQGYFSENSAFGFVHGGLTNNRIEFYAGDSWKARKNFTINYGLHYVRDGGATNSDLPGISLLNGFGPTLGNAVRQPNLNFSPQLGFAWTPSGSDRTVLRAGAGLYYDSNLLSVTQADRSLRLSQGQYYAEQTLCAPGEYSVMLPNGTTITSSDGLNIGSQICGHSPATVINGVTVGKAIADLQGVVQAASAVAGANGFNAGRTGSTLGSVLAPNYQSPRSVAMSFGLQHQFGRSTVMSIDYIRNSGTHFLMGVDRNHVGDASHFNITNAIAAENRTLAANAPSCGQVNSSTSIAGINCYLRQVHGASIADFAVQGLDSSGTFANSAAAFPGNNSALGQGIFFEPIGNSRYRAVDVSLHSTIDRPVRGVLTMNLQAAYSWSKFQSDFPSGNGPLNQQWGVPDAIDWNDPNGHFGSSGMDRTHQFTFGPVLGLRYGFRLSMLAHIDSPLPFTAFLPQLNGGGVPGEIFRSDVTGDGTVGDILSSSSLGEFRSGSSVNALNSLINSFNSIDSGHPTPAGGALITNGLFTSTQLVQLGAVTPALANVPQNLGPAWRKTVDMRLSWPYTFRERFTLEPSVSAFNVFNFANFDSSSNLSSGILQPAGNFSSNGGTGLGCGSAFSCQSVNRVGPGSGVFSQGSPREFEFGLKLTF